MLASPEHLCSSTGSNFTAPVAPLDGLWTYAGDRSDGHFELRAFQAFPEPRDAFVWLFGGFNIAKVESGTDQAMVWSDVNPAKEESRDGTMPLGGSSGARKKVSLGLGASNQWANVLEELKNC